MVEPFRIPRLTSPHARILTACGDILDQEKTQQKKLDALRGKTMIAMEKSGNAVNYVRLMGPSAKRKTHLHVDVASPAYFASPPEATNTVDEIVAFVTYFLGRQYKAACWVRYNAPEKEIPSDSVIRRTAFDMKDKERSMHQVAGRFRFGGFPMDEISWEIIGEEFRSEITVVRNGPLSPTFLADAQLSIDLIYQEMLLGRGAPVVHEVPDELE